MLNKEEYESIEELSKERFGAYAADYVKSIDHANAEELAHLVSVVHPLPAWHMLDVATGGGHTALAFAPWVTSVIASDITPQMLSQAENHIKAQSCTNVRFDVVDALDIPYASDTFDLVTCRIAAHHFSDAALFVREAARVLKPGGFLLVQDHVMPEDDMTARYIEAFEKLRDPSHNRAFSDLEWQDIFDKAGFEVTHVEHIPRRHNFMNWTQRQKVTESTVASLVALALSAPDEVKTFMNPQNIGTPEATFDNLHIIILGRKSAT